MLVLSVLDLEPLTSGSINIQCILNQVRLDPVNRYSKAPPNQGPAGLRHGPGTRVEARGTEPVRIVAGNNIHQAVCIF